MSVEDKNLKKLGPWPQGINNTAQDTELPGGAFREGLNIDLTDEGKPRRRKGFTSVYSGDVRSLYDSGGFTIFAEGADLKRLFSDDTDTTLFSGLDANNRLSYAEVNNVIYFTDGDNNYKLPVGGDTVSGLGLGIPTTVPALSVAAIGGLSAGKYQVAITEVTSTGEESGAGLASVIDVPENGGILVSDLSPSSGAVATNVYISETNGETLYYHSQVAGSTISLGVKILGKKLETQFMERLPAGQVMFYYRGRLWVAKDNVLWFSEPLRYGLCRLSKNFMQFPERITVAIPVLDGIYVAADKTYFLSGTDPMKMEQVVISPDTAVEGTQMLLEPDVFNLDDVIEDTAYWFGSNGAVLGLPSGKTQGIMEDRVVVPDYLSGATMLRAEGGIQQVLTAVRDPGEASTMAVGDVASAEIVRNGVIIS